jgi:UDP-N-acetylglucosamine 2-epimerase (non-hydrolysing)
MEETSVMMVKSRTYYARIGTLALSKVGQERNFRQVADYSMPNVSEKMVRIILSYTDYIKRTVWSE